jgi:hypothetical protein
MPPPIPQNQNSWDPPPFPEHGDREDNELFESIGRALTTWEDLESNLAHLYAALSEKSPYDQPAIYEYGALPNVPSRVSGLARLGRDYFIKYPNQALEGELCWITSNFNRWSQRRNDVAHGVVRLIDIVKDIAGAPSEKSFLGASLEWCLVPPHFKEEKHFTPTTPARILTSIEINRFARAFGGILHRVMGLSPAVELPHFALQRKFVAPPIWPGSDPGST